MHQETGQDYNVLSGFIICLGHRRQTLNVPRGILITCDIVCNEGPPSRCPVIIHSFHNPDTLEIEPRFRHQLYYDYWSTLTSWSKTTCNTHQIHPVRCLYSNRLMSSTGPPQIALDSQPGLLPFSDEHSLSHHRTICIGPRHIQVTRALAVSCPTFAPSCSLY
jgi:hypothetical protein